MSISKWLHSAPVAVVAMQLISCAHAASVARFDWFEYRGIAENPQTVQPGTFQNPVLAGFYPDPSVIKLGSDFYMVNSTFGFFPGIPVWHSRDLVHWRQIGNAIDRPEQINLSAANWKSAPLSGGLWAPSISYHDGLFYIVNTCVNCGGNFVITARDPAGPWSEPVWLNNVPGVDPSLFFDDDGTAWYVYSAAPRMTPLYRGHNALWLQRFDTKALQTVGEPQMLVNGGADISKQPYAIEGPHIFKKDGTYYLIAAEGGTREGHSEVVFRAEHVQGPYVAAPSSVNPILTQRDLDPARANPISSAGHAQFVELDDGSWWTVFLATRPYAKDLYNTGRETFLLPVTWKDCWPTVLARGETLPIVVSSPHLPSSTAPIPTTGDFTWRDEFDRKALSLSWLMMRSPYETWWKLGNGSLSLKVRSEGIGDGKQPSFLGRRLQHIDATVSTVVRFTPADRQTAGLAAVQNDNFFLMFGLTREQGRTIVRVGRRAGPTDPPEGKMIASAPVMARGPLFLRMRLRGGHCDFDYAIKSGAWRNLAHDVDATNLSTAEAAGFVGTVIGPFAQQAAVRAQ